MKFNLFRRKTEELGLLGPDPEDIRDLQLAEIQPGVVSLPEEYDLREKMTSVQRQYYGTCTAHAVDAVKEFLDSQEYHREIKLSQKFIYHNTKKISGLWTVQGDFLRNALKAVCKYGAPLETDWPDEMERNWQEYVRKEPPPEIFKKAEKYKGQTYWRVGTSLETLKQACFQNERPLIISSPWFREYWNVAPDGRLPIPNPKNMVGGHAYVYVGWGRERQWFRNSHGSSWGYKGYFYIPDHEFQYHEFWDAWILLDLKVPERLLEGWVAGKYLKLSQMPGLKIGDAVEPVTALRLRENPGLHGRILRVLKKGEKFEIIEKGPFFHGYQWWKIRAKA